MKNKKSRQANKKLQDESLSQYLGPNAEKNDLYIGIKGFKAIGDETRLRIAPLTIISGTNSAGKSSFMQPLLIMKQTLEASFDPGALLLFGSNAKFTEIFQTLSRTKSKTSRADGFSVNFTCGDFGRSLYYTETSSGYTISKDTSRFKENEVALSNEDCELSLEKYETKFSDSTRRLLEAIDKDEVLSDSRTDGPRAHIKVRRRRCFLDTFLAFRGPAGASIELSENVFYSHTDSWTKILRGIIHVPGLRGNPEREYSKSAVGGTYPGTFETYVASIILEWSKSDQKKLEALSQDLVSLGLTWKVKARQVNDAAVELLVGRMPQAQQGGASDMVSVADVGFGVSQTLPVIVALLAAAPGQIVYLEQPEIHLHPRAQVELAGALTRAAKRGVKVIAETHSSLLIRAIQTGIASGSISETAVSMNWFSRNEQTGFAEVSTANLDNMGRFGDWPLDFDDISQDADMAYIEAVSKRATS